MRDRVARQGFEDDVVLALPLNLTARGNAFGIGQENDLEKNRRVVGGATAAVVGVAFMKGGEIDVLVYQTVERELEGTWLQLFLEVQYNHRALRVVVRLEIRHAKTSTNVRSL